MDPYWLRDGIGCTVFLSNLSKSDVQFRLRYVSRDSEGYMYEGYDLHNEFGSTVFEIPAREKARHMVVGECPPEVRVVVIENNNGD